MCTGCRGRASGHTSDLSRFTDAASQRCIRTAVSAYRPVTSLSPPTPFSLTSFFPSFSPSTETVYLHFSRTSNAISSGSVVTESFFVPSVCPRGPIRVTSSVAVCCRTRELQATRTLWRLRAARTSLSQQDIELVLVTNSNKSARCSGNLHSDSRARAHDVSRECERHLIRRNR